jgi:hypothetical protein
MAAAAEVRPFRVTAAVAGVHRIRVVAAVAGVHRVREAAVAHCCSFLPPVEEGEAAAV